MKNIISKKGFGSIVEVVITAVIFSIAAIGIFASISTLRPDSIAVRKKLQALKIGQQVINELYNDIDATTWDTGNLKTGVTHTQTIDVYSVSYTLTDVAGMDCRELNLTVNYPD